jgi:hypothetical protein
LETGRTFSTIFSDVEHRTQLLECHTEEDFKKVLADNTNAMMERMNHADEKPPTFNNEKVNENSHLFKSIE